MEAVARIQKAAESRACACSLRPVTELEDALSSVDAHSLAAVQRYAVVETQLVLLASVLRVPAPLHLCTPSPRFENTHFKN